MRAFLRRGERLRQVLRLRGTGGESASGAILFALLSALAQAPIRYS